jgi:ribosomal protein S18 acetylase RimI-like enzyme
MTAIDVVDGDGFAPWVFAASQIYGEAMRRPPELVVQRREIMQSHLSRNGFVATVAVDDDLVGFGYGYRGHAGDWWHDLVAAALGAAVSADYLADGLELAELHVAPARHGQGIGRRMLDAILDTAGARSVVLSTHDSDTPARRLYRSRGFVDLVQGFVFPGSTEVYAVMGRRP